jgi:hypothetical protein
VPLAITEEKLQEPVEPEAVKVQVTGEPTDGVAVKVTIAPEVSPATSKVGVLSAVVLSEFDEPVSDAACKSGAGVGVGGRTVTVFVDAPERFPAPSSA